MIVGWTFLCAVPLVLLEVTLAVMLFDPENCAAFVLLKFCAPGV